MRGNFFKMDNDIFKCRLDAYEFLVYSYLVMKADRDKMLEPLQHFFYLFVCGIKIYYLRINIHYK